MKHFNNKNLKTLEKEIEEDARSRKGHVQYWQNMFKLGRGLHPYSDAGSRIIPNPSNVVHYRLEKQP